MAEKRTSFMEQCPGKPVSEVTKLAGAAWKALSDEEKAPYQKLYEAAKAKYATDFAAFIAAGGVKAKGAMALRAEKRKGKEGRTSVTKDANRPKKPAGGAFGCFMAKHRQELMKECEGKITAVPGLASTRWKALSEADKAVFEEAYKEKKTVYEEAMKSYVPPKGAEPVPVASARKGGSAKTSVDAATPGKKKGNKTRTDTEMGPTPSKKVAKKTRASEAGVVAVDDETLSKAKSLSLHSELMNLAGRPEIQGKGFSAVALLAALEKAKGLVNPAKNLLLVAQGN